ncbi:MAG: zinc-dependent metalloprotease [Cyclobacteriaceae bacterium]|nr:zinc-dependent metalloprotease [Cyclobacteriaceae bacterium]
MLKRIFILLIAIPLLTDVGIALAQKKKKDKAVETPKKEEKKKETVEDKVKTSKKTEGLFTVYQDTVNGSVMLYIKKEQLKKEFIYQSFSMGGPPQLFLNQNMLRDTWVFSIKNTFDKLEFVKQNTSYYYDSANALSKAANADVSEAIFYSVKIEAKNDQGYLIKVDDLLLSQKLDQIMPVLPPGFPSHLMVNLGTLKKDNSKYMNIRSYPNNTDFLVNLAFENPKPQNGGGDIVTDARYISVKFQHTFLEIPESNYKPRFDDPRVGYFTEEVDDMTTYSSTPFKDVISRWHLVKKEPTEELSEPVEPIIWWVENTTPIEWRETILTAGRKWNEAFEAAGFKNAVIMKMMPDDADWDPADIRYNVIRWVSSDLGYAIGPSFVNPRTGQILGSDITIDFGIMRGATSESEVYEAFNKEFSVNGKFSSCSIGTGLQIQQGIASTVVESLSDDIADIDKLKHQFLTFLVLHEMGHTMGLNHNMKASQMLTPEELANQEITRKKGVTGSVMDYPFPNLIIQDKPVDFYTTKVGPYDKWAIEFGYRVFPEKEAEGLDKILRRSNEPDLIFGNDADVLWPGNGVDPRVRTWDMSNDMVTYAEYQFKLANETLDKLYDKFVKEGESYQTLRQKYASIRNHRYSMTMSIAGYIGGVYVDRSFPEQKSVGKPLTPVPEAKQKQAMNLLKNYVFSPDAYEKDAQLFPYLQLQRRGFNFFGSPEDPNVQAYAVISPSIIYQFILNGTTLQRINNTGLYGNTYSVSEVLNDLVGAVFDADIRGSVNLYRQNAQTELVVSLSKILTAKSGYDNASRAASYAALISLQKRLKSASVVGDTQTKAHRSYLVYKIAESLEVK